MLLRHVLRCELSGLAVGTLEVQTTAGALPYLNHWNKCVVRHPVFSLDDKRLFQFVKGEWERLAALAEDAEITEAESDILRVGYLAVLHTLDCVRQDVPALPSLAMVQTTMKQLFALAYWKYYLESERFSFPTYHISKYNTNIHFENLPEYLELCFEVRHDYEKKRHEAVEAEKIRQAEKLLIALNSTWVTPASKRLLWQWVKAHLPEQYKPDAEGWLSTLFLGASGAIIEFEQEDIQLAEEIIVSSCPTGTGVLKAVRERLAVIRSQWEQHHKAFEIDLEDFAPTARLFVNGEKVVAPDPGAEPKQSDFKNLAQFLIAQAQWTIAKRAFDKGGNNESL